MTMKVWMALLDKKKGLLTIKPDDNKPVQEEPMDPEAQPTPIKGERNIHCPHYSDCLNYVVNHFWESWSCSECPHRNMKLMDEVGYGANGEGLDYELSPDIIRKIRENESG
jgi:hypothetical protein